MVNAYTRYSIKNGKIKPKQSLWPGAILLTERTEEPQQPFECHLFHSLLRTAFSFK